MPTRCILFLLLLAACGGAQRMEPSAVLTRSDQISAAVGKAVTLRGVVENSKNPTLLGVEVASDSPDLRGKPATATGVLERTTVTQEELNREIAERGQVANRGPGTFYRLVDPATGQLAQVR